MKKGILILFPISLLLIQCAVTLTNRGSQVQTVTDEQRNCCCTFITVVATVDDNTHSHDKAMSAMNKARNEVARLGGNAMHILDIEAGHHGVMVVVEALVCDQRALNDVGPADEVGMSEHNSK